MTSSERSGWRGEKPGAAQPPERKASLLCSSHLRGAVTELLTCPGTSTGVLLHHAHVLKCGPSRWPHESPHWLARRADSEVKHSHCRSDREGPMQASTAGGDAERQLAAFIRKFSPMDQRLIRTVRAALRKRFPAANELVYDNYNFFVIGYSPTERPSDAIVSMAARAHGVSLCFIHGAPCLLSQQGPSRLRQSNAIHSRRFAAGLGAPRGEGSRRGGHCSGAGTPFSRWPRDTYHSLGICEPATSQETVAAQEPPRLAATPKRD